MTNHDFQVIWFVIAGITLVTVTFIAVILTAEPEPEQQPLVSGDINFDA